jgi:hypothetical protein
METGPVKLPCSQLIKNMSYTHIGEWRYSSTSALDGCEFSVSGPAPLNPGEVATSTHWIGGWVFLGAGLEAVEKRKIFPLPGIEPGPSSL